MSKNFLVINDLEQAHKYALLALNSNKKNYKSMLLCGQICYRKEMYLEAYNYLLKARTQKQKDYKLDLPEALELMDKIIEETNNFTLSEDKHFKGIISQYNADRGFGFISIQKNSQKYFFHISQLTNMPQPKVGDRVKFSIEKTPKGYQAKHIIYI